MPTLDRIIDILTTVKEEKGKSPHTPLKEKGETRDNTPPRACTYARVDRQRGKSPQPEIFFALKIKGENDVGAIFMSTEWAKSRLDIWGAMRLRGTARGEARKVEGVSGAEAEGSRSPGGDDKGAQAELGGI